MDLWNKLNGLILAAMMVAVSAFPVQAQGQPIVLAEITLDRQPLPDNTFANLCELDEKGKPKSCLAAFSRGGSVKWDARITGPHFIQVHRTIVQINVIAPITEVRIDAWSYSTFSPLWRK